MQNMLHNSNVSSPSSTSARSSIWFHIPPTVGILCMHTQSLYLPPRSGKQGQREPEASNSLPR